MTRHANAVEAPVRWAASAIAAIIVAVGWVQLVEGIVTLTLPEVGQWLPADAVRALTFSPLADRGPLR